MPIQGRHVAFAAGGAGVTAAVAPSITRGAPRSEHSDAIVADAGAKGRVDSRKLRSAATGEGFRVGNEGYTARLAQKMREKGFDKDQPVRVGRHKDGSVTIVDGHHRLRAAEQAGVRDVPTEVVETGQKRYKRRVSLPGALGHDSYIRDARKPASRLSDEELARRASKRPGPVGSAVNSVNSAGERVFAKRQYPDSGPYEGFRAHVSPKAAAARDRLRWIAADSSAKQGKAETRKKMSAVYGGAATVAGAATGVGAGAAAKRAVSAADYGDKKMLSRSGYALAALSAAGGVLGHNVQSKKEKKHKKKADAYRSVAQMIENKGLARRDAVIRKRDYVHVPMEDAVSYYNSPEGRKTRRKQRKAENKYVDARAKRQSSKQWPVTVGLGGALAAGGAGITAGAKGIAREADLDTKPGRVAIRGAGLATAALGAGAIASGLRAKGKKAEYKERYKEARKHRRKMMRRGVDEMVGHSREANLRRVKEAESYSGKTYKPEKATFYPKGVKGD